MAFARCTSGARVGIVTLALAGCGARTELTIDVGSTFYPPPATGLDAASGSDSSGLPASTCGPRVAVCPGDACTGGTCVPRVLASAPAGILGMAIDDSYVYFTDSGDNLLRRVPKCGGELVVLAPTQTFPGDVVAVGARVYWGNRSLAGSIESVPSRGGIPQTVAAWTVNEPIGLVADASRLYFSVEAGDATNQGVSAVPLDGGAVVRISKHMVTALAIDDMSLYGGTNTDGGLDILRIPKSGGDGTVVASTAGVNGIAVDATFLYWTTRLEYPNGTVSRITKSGGSPVPLAMLDRSPGPIAVDDRCVYWGDDGFMPATGTLGRMPISGGPPQTLATSQDNPSVIALDATSVYWANFNGLVMRVPK